MEATENFIVAARTFQMSQLKEAGNIERITPDELEHWLTTEYLPEDFKEAGTGFAWLLPGIDMPAGLKSRGLEFVQNFRSKAQCITELEQMKVQEIRQGKLPNITLNYGTSCGQTNDLGGCSTNNIQSKWIHKEQRLVCADHGTDECCAKHDLVRSDIEINALASFTPCKANDALKTCLASVNPKLGFKDAHGVSESLANRVATCIYNVMPCLATTHNRFYEIDFNAARNVPYIRTITPASGDNHMQIVMPFHRTWNDNTQDNAVYRNLMKSRVDHVQWRHIDPPANNGEPS